MQQILRKGQGAQKTRFDDPDGYFTDFLCTGLTKAQAAHFRHGPLIRALRAALFAAIVRSDRSDRAGCAGRADSSDHNVREPVTAL